MPRRSAALIRQLNARLRSAILSARAQGTPNDNIERAIKRGTGEGAEATHYDEIIYEGYGPGGVAVIVEAATENKHRTAAEMRLRKPILDATARKRATPTTTNGS